MNAATKRSREEGSASPSSSQSFSPSPSPTPKALRASPPSPSSNIRQGRAPLLCTLPPTCHPPQNPPTELENSKELETHYAKYHAHVCEERGCNAVFPSARLLELHQTECHDPLAAVRREKGEKIFACHLETCQRVFADPKKRRLHLIQAHGFPKEYFFAVTNKGVGGLLKKWGEGASLIRGTWKAREKSGEDVMDIEEDEDGKDEDEGNTEDMLSTGTVTNEKTNADISRNISSTSHPTSVSDQQRKGAVKSTGTQHADLDALTNSLDSLSLVPPNIRFGRGGKGGRLVRQGPASNRGRTVSDIPERNKPREAGGQLSTTASGSIAQPTAFLKSEPLPNKPVNREGGSDEGGISININAALEALKSEASSSATQVTSKTEPPHPSDGGRGRGPGRARGRSRGRGFPARGRS